MITSKQLEQLNALDFDLKNLRSDIRKVVIGIIVPKILKPTRGARAKIFEFSMPLIYNQEERSTGYTLMELYRHIYFKSIGDSYLPRVDIDEKDYVKYYNSAVKYYTKQFDITKNEFLELLQENLYNQDTKEIR